MLTTLAVVLPIFALILSGYLCRRFGALGEGAASELNRFVVRLALPALLFDIMAHAKWADLDQPAFTAVFGLGCAAVSIVTLLARFRTSRSLADASIDGLNAGYSNAGFIGLPLCAIVFGKESLALATIATIMTVCVLFAVAIVLVEFGLQSEPRPVALTLRVAKSLISNPLLVAPALGAAIAASGLALPGAANVFLTLLGNAASPCALVTLGLFLAQTMPTDGAQKVVTLALVVLKLVVQPAIVWLLAAFVFRLTDHLTHIVVLFAALPTGTGPFMLAEFYRREAAVTSNVILISTSASLITISAYLALVL
jgi:malonate transporter